MFKLHGQQPLIITVDFLFWLQKDTTEEQLTQLPIMETYEPFNGDYHHDLCWLVW